MNLCFGIRTVSVGVEDSTLTGGRGADGIRVGIPIGPEAPYVLETNERRKVGQREWRGRTAPLRHEAPMPACIPGSSSSSRGSRQKSGIYLEEDLELQTGVYPASFGSMLIASKGHFYRSIPILLAKLVRKEPVCAAAFPISAVHERVFVLFIMRPNKKQTANKNHDWFSLKS